MRVEVLFELDVVLPVVAEVVGVADAVARLAEEFSTRALRFAKPELGIRHPVVARVC
jgi:PII-like signaling protein